MLEHRHSLKGSRTAVAMLVALIMVATLPGSASSKKKAPAPAPAKMDLSRFVWPKAPAITRIKFLDFFSAEKRDSTNQKKKSGYASREGIRAYRQCRRYGRDRALPWWAR